jgi:hypothetical protein
VHVPLHILRRARLQRLAPRIQVLRVRVKPAVCLQELPQQHEVVNPVLARETILLLPSKECMHLLLVTFLVHIQWLAPASKAQAVVRAVPHVAAVVETLQVAVVLPPGAQGSGDIVRARELVPEPVQVPVVQVASARMLPRRIQARPTTTVVAVLAVAVAAVLQVLSVVREASLPRRVSHAGQSAKNSRR